LPMDPDSVFKITKLTAREPSVGFVLRMELGGLWFVGKSKMLLNMHEEWSCSRWVIPGSLDKAKCNDQKRSRECRGGGVVNALASRSQPRRTNLD
jgi:hypothetical protein